MVLQNDTCFVLRILPLNMGIYNDCFSCLYHRQGWGISPAILWEHVVFHMLPNACDMRLRHKMEDWPAISNEDWCCDSWGTVWGRVCPKPFWDSKQPSWMNSLTWGTARITESETSCGWPILKLLKLAGCLTMTYFFICLSIGGMPGRTPFSVGCRLPEWLCFPGRYVHRFI